MKNKWKAWALPVLLVGGLYLALYLVGVGCPIRWLTGVSCAGCGLTRAWLCALRLDWRGAFYWHPLFWMVPAVVLAGCGARGPHRRLCCGVLAVFMVSYLVLYVLRLLDPADTVVSVELERGAVWRALYFVRENVG